MVSFPATRVISKYFCGEIVKTYCSIAKPVGKPQFYFEFNSVEWDLLFYWIKLSIVSHF